MKSPAAPRWIGVADAMRVTGLSRRALEGRVRRGTLPVKRVRGRVMYDLVALYESGLTADTLPLTVSEMLERIETLARRVGELESELRQHRGT